MTAVVHLFVGIASASVGFMLGVAWHAGLEDNEIEDVRAEHDAYRRHAETELDDLRQAHCEDLLPATLERIGELG